MTKLPIKIHLDESFFQEEIKCDYKVTTQSKKLWAVLLDLLVEFDRVCKEEGIKYSLDSGSFLGAVRHNGFIPWDNDIDVIMHRSEYDRFCAIADKKFKHPYFWQTPYSDVGSSRRNGQLRNSLTTYILQEETKGEKLMFTFNQGVFLDVFVLDEVPDNTNEYEEYRKEMQSVLPLMWDFKQFYSMSGKSEWIGAALTDLHNRYDNICSQFNGTGKRRIGNMSLVPDRPEEKTLPHDIFDNLVEYEFEGFFFPGPRDYDTYLTTLYGDWHKYVKGGELHCVSIIDLTTSYKDYIAERGLCDFYDKTPHPMVKLYEHRDELLRQRDEAWHDLTVSTEIITRNNSIINEKQCEIDKLQNYLTSKQNMVECLQYMIDCKEIKIRKYRKLFKLLAVSCIILVGALLFLAGRYFLMVKYC